MGQGDDAALLSSALGQLAQLLSAVGEAEWAGRVRRAMTRIDGGDAAGLEDVVRIIARPGDGGLNDLVIHPLHGHAVDDDEDLDEINQRLGLITARCFRLAARQQRQGRDTPG